MLLLLTDMVWGIEALPGAQAPWPHCAGLASWSESARLLPGLSWSQSNLLRGPLACWCFLPIGVVVARFTWAVTYVGPAASQLRQPLGPGWVRGASLWGVRRDGPSPPGQRCVSVCMPQTDGTFTGLAAKSPLPPHPWHRGSDWTQRGVFMPQPRGWGSGVQGLSWGPRRPWGMGDSGWW